MPALYWGNDNSDITFGGSMNLFLETSQVAVTNKTITIPASGAYTICLITRAGALPNSAAWDIGGATVWAYVTAANTNITFTASMRRWLSTGAYATGSSSSNSTSLAYTQNYVTTAPATSMTGAGTNDDRLVVTYVFRNTSTRKAQTITLQTDTPISVDFPFVGSISYNENIGQTNVVDMGIVSEEVIPAGPAVYDELGLGQEIKVSSDLIWTAGPESESISNSIEVGNTGVVKLDDTHILAVFYEPSTSQQYASVGTISPTGITFGSRYSLGIGLGYVNLTLCALDANHVIIAYPAYSGSYGKILSVVIDGNVITVGTIQTVMSAITRNFSLCKMDGTHVLLTYYGNNFGYVVSQIVTVNGTTLTLGAYKYLSDVSTDYPTVGKIDDTHYIVFCVGPGAIYRCYAYLITVNISTDSVLYGARNTVSSIPISYTYARMLDSNHVFLTYIDKAAPNYMYARIVTIDGSYALSYGPEFIIRTVAYANGGIAIIDSSHVAMVYSKELLYLTITGNDISFGSWIIYDASATYSTIDTIDVSRIAIAYRDAAPTVHGAILIYANKADYITSGAPSSMEENVGQIIIAATGIAFEEYRVPPHEQLYQTIKVVTGCLDTMEASIYNELGLGQTIKVSTGIIKDIIPFHLKILIIKNI